MNPHMTDIGVLPSNFVPYAQKKMNIRPFTVREMRLMSIATVTNDVTPCIEAVGHCIDMDVNKLTIGDFYYALAWLRIFSTTKTPWVVSWDCTEKYYKHKEKDEFVLNDVPPSQRPTDLSAYELLNCGTSNTYNAHISDLEILQLPENFEGLPPGCDWPRVEILKESREALRDPSLNMIVAGAQWVDIAGVVFPAEMQNATVWQKKIWHLENQPDLDLFDTCMATNIEVVHGISESCIVQCRSCRQKFTHAIKLDPLSFFR